MTLRHAIAVGLVTAIAGWFAASCASSAAQDATGARGSGGACSGCADAGSKDSTVEISLPTADSGDEEAEAGAFNPACGPGCSPDDADACLDFDAGPVDLDSGSPPPDTGGDATGTVDAATDVTSDDAASDDAALDAMMRYVDGPVPGPAPPNDDKTGKGQEEPGPAFGCHVRRVGGVPASVCEPAGAGRDGDPCMSSSDCAAGYGCIGNTSTGVCRQFCCGDREQCTAGSYCADRMLRDDSASSAGALKVPACVPADDCTLADPYPCPEGQACTCPDGQACTIVRPDGTTSCVEPGGGVAGEACPCAAGHICSMATNHCLKICKLDTSTNECGSGRCQATTNFPEGFGVCVGVPADGG